MEYKIYRVLEKSRFIDYQNLFRLSFGNSKLNEDYLKWLYIHCPDGKVIGYDAYHGEKLIAHYSIVPRIYRYKSQKVLGALSLNTATAPNYQGKGLFTKLARATYETAFSEGVKFVTGVANKNSVYGFVNKLNFKRLGSVELAIGYQFESDYDHESHLTLNLSNEFVNWKFDNPNSRYFRIDNVREPSYVCVFKNGVPFIIENSGRIDLSVLSPTSNLIRTVPKLFPFYNRKLINRILVPEILKPSPWHVLWRDLDSEYSELSDQFSLCGFDMDTF